MYSQNIDGSLCKNRKDLKKQYGENFRDSIRVFSTNNYKRDLKYMNRLSGLNNLIIIDFHNCFKGFSALFYRKEKKGRKKLTIPQSVISVEFKGKTPLPLPFDFSQNKNKLESLLLNYCFIPNKIDTVHLDFSELLALKHFSLFIYSVDFNYSHVCVVKMPPNLMSFEGDISTETEVYNCSPLFFIYYDHLPLTIEYLDLRVDSIYPRQFFELTNLKTLRINNDQPLTEDFLSFKTLKSITLDNFTSQDVLILSQMSSVDTIVWNNKKPFFPRELFLDIAKGIPLDLSKLKVKCIMVSGFGEMSPAGGGWQYNLHIAKIIKRRMPKVNVFYYVGYNKPMREVTETDFKQKDFYDCKSLDE